MSLTITNSGTVSNDLLPSLPIALPAFPIFTPSHSTTSGTAKAFNWSDQANWSGGAVPNSNLQQAITIAPGAVGTIVDDIKFLSVAGLTFAAGASALRIGDGSTLSIATTVKNGVIGVGAHSVLLEQKSGLSYVNLTGANASVAMAGTPQGYIIFSGTAGIEGSLFITQPQLHTATGPGVDSQYIQNFAVGDHIYIEEKQTRPLTATYTPTNATYGTLLLSDGTTPIYEFTHFQGNSTTNYVVTETAINDPLLGLTNVPALELTVSTTPRSTTLAPGSPAGSTGVATPGTLPSGGAPGTTTAGSSTGTTSQGTPGSGTSSTTTTGGSTGAAGSGTSGSGTPGTTTTGGSTGAAGSGTSGSGGTASTGTPTPTPPTGPVVSSPSIPQPAGPSQVVGLVLQNPGSGSLAAREITFGQEFQQGQVPAGQRLVAMIGGAAVPVQMDVKTTNPDGSVAMAVLTMQQPAIAANTSVPVMLALAPAAGAPSAPVDISALASPSSGYSLQVNLTLHNADGSTTPVSIDAAKALGAALASGTYSTWLSGPQATQVRIDVPVAGSLHITMDVTAYADGTTSTDVVFNNDIAMSPSGGTVTYDAAIVRNGTVAFQQNGITQYQYTSWDQTVASNGLPGVNVQHDIAALEKTGLVQNYDLSTGVATSMITLESTQMAKPGFASVLGTAGITQYMPETGGRWDIGPTTTGNTIWLMTQNATAAQYALAQAHDAGSIPWALYDAKSGTYLMSTAYPKLWADNRAGGTGGVTALTQNLPSMTQTGWAVDPAHEPDLNYVAYLMTGDRRFLDLLNAEASYDLMTDRPTSSGGPMPSGRQGALGIVADGAGQVRAQAWDLREIVEAAAANPAGSAEKAYFTQVETNNFNNLLALAGRLNEGEASGWVTGTYTAGLMAPWQQDYIATSVVLGAEQGNASAVKFLGWETNFLAGRFLASGISPYMATDYNLATYVAGQPEDTSALQTWSAISSATVATGIDGPAGNTTLSRAYAQGARAALAGDITVSEDPRAIQAFGWVTAYEQLNNAYNQASPYLNIVPRLSDGNLLTGDHIFVTSDTVSRVIQGSTTADQLIYETGSANVTIQGGTGINILFAGTGANTLIGGVNNDYLFAGSGTDVLSAGGGTNFMRAGSGADTFLLDASQAATDTIADFKIGTDKLHVVSGGSPPSAATIGGLLAGATPDGAGGSVLHLSGAHSVTLTGVGPGQLSNAMFA